MKKTHAFIAYEGPSMLDGSPIMLLVTRASKQSANRKTGAVIQTYILRSDLSPVEASRNGSDVSICGNCPHRQAINGTCYVNLAQGPSVVFKAFKRGIYPSLTPEHAARELNGDMVRLGTYGDPTAVPFEVWETLLAQTSGHLGYTHQWKDARFARFAKYCMASADSPEEYIEARQRGWRAFYVLPKGYQHKVPHAFLCPASEEAGKKLHCLECRACDGTATNRTASVFIPVHGLAFKQTRFTNLVTIDRR